MANILTAKFGIGIGVILFTFLNPGIPQTIKIPLIGLGLILITGYPFGVGYGKLGGTNNGK